ncbi:MAG: hypothetical protein QXS91_02585 [Candidatus Anstonellales archaeon]
MLSLLVEFLLLFLYPIAIFYPWKKENIIIYKKHGRKMANIRVADTIIAKLIGHMFSENKESILFNAPCCLWMQNINKDIIAYALVEIKKEKEKAGIKAYKIKYKRILKAHSLESICFNDCDAVLECFQSL